MQPFLVTVEVLGIGTAQLERLQVLRLWHHPLDMLEAVILYRCIANHNLDLVLLRVQPLPLIEINGQPEQEASIAAEHRREHTQIHNDIGVLQSTVGIEQVVRLNQELR